MAFDEQGHPVYGRLATDRTHQIKAQLLYDLPFGTLVGASWYGASGIPRTRRVPFNFNLQHGSIRWARVGSTCRCSRGSP